jgi:hypothetical protein
LLSGPGMIRTCGTWFRKPLLYPLSYEFGYSAAFAKGIGAPTTNLEIDNERFDVTFAIEVIELAKYAD